MSGTPAQVTAANSLKYIKCVKDKDEQTPIKHNSNYLIHVYFLFIDSCSLILFYKLLFP